jgi:hypothetical protein
MSDIAATATTAFERISGEAWTALYDRLVAEKLIEPEETIYAALTRLRAEVAQLSGLHSQSPQTLLLGRILAYLEGGDPKATSGGERNSDLRNAVRAALEASK